MTPASTHQKGHADEIQLRHVDGPSPARDGGIPKRLLGQVVKGRYRVLRKLGAGRLATVYLGEEVATARRVALKVFHRKFSKDPEFVDQLQRQAQLAMSLREKHPCIASVYACDRTDDGSSFLAMEHLDGKSLRDVIRQEGPLDVERALRLAAQIAEGLEAAHDLGIIHADLRPRNVMLVTEGEKEAVKLKGFDAAGLSEAGLAGHLARAGLLPGTPEYATPEQIEGGVVTPRTDIYALGAILYEMLCGVAPFRASTPDGILAKHLQEIPTPLKALRPEIPSVVELKILQALEKEPEKRHRYVADVANEYLCDLAMDELALERARRKYGLILKPVLAVRAYFAGTSETDDGEEEERPGRRWKIAAVAAVLALVSVPALWILASRQAAEVPRTPSLQSPLTEGPVREGSEKGGDRKAGLQPSKRVVPVEVPPEVSEAGAQPVRPQETIPEPKPSDEGGLKKKGGASPAVQPHGRPSSQSPEVKNAPQKRTKRPEQPDALTSEGAAADLTQNSKTPPAPRKEGARREPESPDPTAIIDWLLKQPSGKE